MACFKRFNIGMFANQARVSTGQLPDVRSPADRALSLTAPDSWKGPVSFSA